jgi:hypothetical protein
MSPLPQGYKVATTSTFTQAPITILVNGFRRPSANKKTGPMIQVYFTPSGIHPVEALKTGKDRSVCYRCPQRHSTGGGCYVGAYTLTSIPTAVDNASTVSADQATAHHLWRTLLKGRAVRFGTWGDPASAPPDIIVPMMQATEHRTAYTHFPKRAPHLKGLAQASCESPKQAAKLQADGWRTFRASRSPAATVTADEILCPYYTTGIQCIACGLCDGQSANVVAPIHGTKARKFRSPKQS